MKKEKRKKYKRKMKKKKENIYDNTNIPTSLDGARATAGTRR